MGDRGGDCSVAVIYAEGRVIREYERNGYDDSDFYAVYWNGQKPVTVQYASTRGWTYANGAAVDATPEVLAEYEAYANGVRRGHAAAFVLAAAEAPHKGARVVVKRALKRTPKGTEGIVFWIGRGRSFSGSRYGHHIAAEAVREAA